MSKIWFRLAGALIVILYASVLLFGWKEYNLWTQITSLLGANPLELFSENHPHALRYALMYPLIVLGEAIGARQDDVFTSAVFFSIVASGVLMAKMSNELMDRDARKWYVHFPALMFALSAIALVMNGRIAMAMLGICVIGLAQVRWLRNRYTTVWKLALVQGLGLWLMSVSSGTFIVGLLMVLVFTLAMPVATFPHVSRRNVRVIVSGVLFIIALVPIGLAFIDKSVRFFGGGLTGLIGVFEHGLGLAIVRLGSTVLITMSLLAIPGMILFIVFLANSRTRLKYGSPYPPIQLAVILATCFIVFGFSTMLVSIPLWLTLLYTALLNNAPGLPVRQDVAPDPA